MERYHLRRSQFAAIVTTPLSVLMSCRISGGDSDWRRRQEIVDDRITRIRSSGSRPLKVVTKLVAKRSGPAAQTRMEKTRLSKVRRDLNLFQLV